MLNKLSPKALARANAEQTAAALVPRLVMNAMGESLASRIARRRQDSARRRELESPREATRAWDALCAEFPEVPYAWALVPDDLLRIAFRHLIEGADDIPTAARWLRDVGFVCRSWSKVAYAKQLWEKLCRDRWPETRDMAARVPSHKLLYYRMAKADRGVAIREQATELHFMVRLTVGPHLALAYTFRWSDIGEDGTWAIPSLEIPADYVREYAAENDFGPFTDFADWWHITITVRAEEGSRGSFAPLVAALRRLLTARRDASRAAPRPSASWTAGSRGSSRRPAATCPASSATRTSTSTRRPSPAARTFLEPASALL